MSPAVASGGLAALQRTEPAGVTPSLGWSLEHERGGDDVIRAGFFDRMAEAPAVEYGWEGWSHPPNRFPMAYSDVSMIAATYTLPADEARALVPAAERLEVVLVTPRRSLITFFAFDYRKGGLGRYRELGAAIPVTLDRGRAPVVHALAERLRPGGQRGIGNYAVQLPVDQERACEAGIRLYGLPKLVGEAGFELERSSGRAWLDHDGMRMAEIRVEIEGDPRPSSHRLPFRTITELDGRAIETVYEVVAEGHVTRRGEASFEPGDHPRFAPLRGLSLGRRPVELRLIERLNWIIWEPRDRGPLQRAGAERPSS